MKTAGKVLIGVLIIAGILTAFVSSMTVRVGSRVCGEAEENCYFNDHVLTVWPSGTICPTWNVQFAHYLPAGQPTDTYAITTGPNEQAIVSTLRNASENNQQVKVWYAGEDYALYLKCKADYKFVIYAVQIVDG
ncbi:MAG: hypothetical protein HYS87_02775 [Candidatus Colwellbacteria bacterium]|nr:hypothetical protein [Candidatus Colwellbacteria bacterium]